MELYCLRHDIANHCTRHCTAYGCLLGGRGAITMLLTLFLSSSYSCFSLSLSHSLTLRACVGVRGIYN